jgi:hypothetical protein
MIASRKTLLVLISINALAWFYYSTLLRARRLDFQAFYCAGEAARQAPDHIYDLDYQRSREQSHFGDDVWFLAFFHPPHELVVFAPFSLLPYAASLAAWRVFSLLCLVGSGLLLGRALCVNRVTAVLFVSAMAQVGVCLVLGQDSLLLLVLMCGCFNLLKKERDVAAAFVLSMALFKPQLPVILAIALLAFGKKKFFAWFAGTGAVLAAASLWFVGRDGLQQMLQGEKLAEIYVFLMPTVRGLTAFVFADYPRLAFTVLAVAVVAMFSVWRRSHSLEFAVGSAICLGCAFAPYLHMYDHVVLAIPLALIAQKPQKNDALIGAILTSGSVLLLLIIFHAMALPVIPTLALGVMTFRLASPMREPVTELAAETGLT